MKGGQKDIYYACGETLEKIEKLPTKRGRFFNEESYIRLKIKHILYGQEPEKALKELSEKIEQAEKTPHFDEWVKNHRPWSWSVQEFLSDYSPRDSKPSLSIDFIEQKI